MAIPNSPESRPLSCLAELLSSPETPADGVTAWPGHSDPQHGPRSPGLLPGAGPFYPSGPGPTDCRATGHRLSCEDLCGSGWPLPAVRSCLAWRPAPDVEPSGCRHRHDECRHRRRRHCNHTPTATRRRARPMLSRMLNGTTFCTNTIAPMTTIQVMLITPSANSANMKPALQPTQIAPQAAPPATARRSFTCPAMGSQAASNKGGGLNDHTDRLYR